MSFNTFYKRNNFVERDRLPTQIKNHRRDPFEGDPFKVQSMNFRYADKPSFYPISSRGKRQINPDCPLKNIYYNHDHTISQCDKENVPNCQANKIRKSSSSLSLVGAKPSSTTKTFSSISQQDKKDSLTSGSNRKKNCSVKSSDFIKSKSFITQPTVSTPSTVIAPIQSVLKKRTLKPRNTLDLSEPTESMADINLDHNGSCHITIKINGVPKNRVHINKNDDNVAINLTKAKKIKKPKSPKLLSPHALKPSRSYVILRNDRTPDAPQDSIKIEPTRKESSTLSMIPHREEKNTSKETNVTSSIADTIKTYSGDQMGNLRRNLSQTTIRNKNLEKHASMLEKILSNNPIVMQQPKSRTLFAKSKSFLGQRSSSMAIPGHFNFQKANPKSF